VVVRAGPSASVRLQPGKRCKEFAQNPHPGRRSRAIQRGWSGLSHPYRVQVRAVTLRPAPRAVVAVAEKTREMWLGSASGSRKWLKSARRCGRAVGWPAVVQAARGGLQVVRSPARVQARTCFTRRLSSPEVHRRKGHVGHPRSLGPHCCIYPVQQQQRLNENNGHGLMFLLCNSLRNVLFDVVRDWVGSSVVVGYLFFK
jgi:hypothetical protein